MPAAMQVADDVGRGEETEKLFAMAVMMRWAELDPAGAVKQLSLNSNVGPFIEARDVLLPAWAKRDPGAAIAYAKGLEKPDEQKKALRLIFETVARRNVDEAIQLARANAPDLIPEEGLPSWILAALPAGAESAQRCVVANDRQGVTSVVGRWAEEDFAAAKAWAQQLSDPKMKGAAFGTMAWRRAGKDPNAALDILPDVSPDWLANAAYAVVKNWPQAELDALKERISKMPDGETSGELAGRFAARLAETNKADASQMITSLPAGTARDSASERYAESLGGAEGAQWALSIAEPNRRKSAVRLVIQRWFSSSPREAYDWLRDTERVTDEEVEEILSN